MKYYHYNIREGVTQYKSKTKRYVAAIIAGIAIVLSLAVPAIAASNNYCGSSANGCAAASEAGAQCDSGAGSGAFGAFGKDNNWKGGANGTNTGIANSSVCGNRQK